MTQRQPHEPAPMWVWCVMIRQIWFFNLMLLAILGWWATYCMNPRGAR